MASRRYTAKEAARILFELPYNGDIGDDEDELENDGDIATDNGLEDSDIQMRTTTYQLHWREEGVVVLDMGAVVVEGEQENKTGNNKCDCSRRLIWCQDQQRISLVSRKAWANRMSSSRCRYGRFFTWFFLLMLNIPCTFLPANNSWFWCTTYVCTFLYHFCK